MIDEVKKMKKNGTQSSKRPYKIGYGYDSHRFLTESERKGGEIETATDVIRGDKPLIIGGFPVDLETQKKYGPFKARSDGDVLYHAVVNAILSAVGDKAARDIGTLFPNTAKENTHRDSGDFLKKAVEILEGSGYELADLKIMLKGKIRVDFGRVEEKLYTFFARQELYPEIHAQGTSGEEMDGAGQGKGVEVFAIALIQLKTLS